MNRRVLCVDDEVNLLNALARHLRTRFELTTAVGPMEGLRVLGEQPAFAAVVSDLRMPCMNGIEFLSRVKQLAPSSVRVMLTGNGDFETAMAAVNEGNIFRFLTKPCASDILAAALESCVEQFRLQTLERDLLERTVSGSVELVCEILSLVNPAVFNRSHRIRAAVRHMAQQMEWKDQWQFDVAAMLSQLGCIAVPPDVLDRAMVGGDLSKSERKALSSHPGIGRDLLAKIPRFELIAEIVAAHRQAVWSKLADDADPLVLGPLVLRIAVEFDELRANGLAFHECLARLNAKGVHHPRLLAALKTMAAQEPPQSVKLVRIADLQPGMTLDEDVHTKSGVLLVKKGNQVTPSVVIRLRTFAECQGVVEPLRVTLISEPQEVSGRMGGPSAI